AVPFQQHHHHSRDRFRTAPAVLFPCEHSRGLFAFSMHFCLEHVVKCRACGCYKEVWSSSVLDRHMKRPFAHGVTKPLGIADAMAMIGSTFVAAIFASTATIGPCSASKIFSSRSPPPAFGR